MCYDVFGLGGVRVRVFLQVLLITRAAVGFGLAAAPTAFTLFLEVK